MTIAAGSVRMDNMGALGGNAATGVAAPLLVSNATIVVNSTGNNDLNRTRLSSTISLDNAAIVRNQLTPGLGASSTNGDSRFASDVNGFFVGGPMTVAGNSVLSNLETRTAGASDMPGGNGSGNVLEVYMPVVVTGGSTLTMNSVNDQASLVGGLPTGDIANTAVALRGVQTSVNPNDSITLQSGATLKMTGAGEKRIGASATGKPVVARGTSASESTIQADTRTYLTDNAGAGAVNSLLVVAGSGNGGLRIEAPMNAVYGGGGTLSTSGLFGINPDAMMGNVYTMLSPKRYAALSGYPEMPTQGADGSPITLGGTVTIVATDPAGAIGDIDNGPAVGTSIRISVDNAASSGSLTYTISPSANGGAFSSFGGIVLKRSFGGQVTSRLLGDATLNGTGPATTTYDHLGGNLDLNGHSLTVGAVATLSAGTISGAGSVNAASVSKIGSTSFVVAPGARINSAGAIAVSAGTLQLNGNLTASRASSVSVTGFGAIDLATNSFVVDYSGASPVNAIRSLLAQGYNNATWTGAGITSSAAAVPGAGTAIGFAEAPEVFATLPNTFAGQSIDSTSLILRYTVIGDANLDGTTDTIDFNLLASNFSSTGARWSKGDFNYDATVDTIDFNLLAANFSKVLPADAPQSLGALVPEPSAAAAVLSSLALLAPRRRRRGHI